ncbi:hypothetical protein LSTR_LSTR008453 [Laodelphax striatellus]|uniref:Uncharacterized protein n=1 Tax=Laodelphax striatellus TaxID=195883 RepID=A0A482XVD4_LAOST|nr:hypothetical protein LSTR_LSTR008453 [Laodelphax striatellus]
MARLLTCIVPVAIILVMVACQLETAHSQPLWFDQLLEPYNYYNERPYYQQQPAYQRPRQQGARQLGGKERYKKLCRVVSGDNYAFPGSIPYPSSPFCPY